MPDAIFGKSQQNKMGRPRRANTPSINVNKDEGYNKLHVQWEQEGQTFFSKQDKV